MENKGNAKDLNKENTKKIKQLKKILEKARLELELIEHQQDVENQE